MYDDEDNISLFFKGVLPTLIILIASLLLSITTGLITFFALQSIKRPVNIDSRYETALKEYNWSLICDDGDTVDRYVDGLAKLFPCAGRSDAFKDAVREQLHRRFLDDGYVEMDKFLAMLDSVSETVFDPKDSVCRKCRFKVGPTVGDFMKSCRPPSYRKDGGIQFPFELKMDGGIGYYGHVVLYADRVLVTAAHKNFNNGSFCTTMSAVVYACNTNAPQQPKKESIDENI